MTRKDKVAGSYLGKLGVGAGDDEREKVRATTLSAVARTTVSAFIWVFAVLAILGIFSINLGPLIAGAGIAGIAVGLGAQQLVKDCIAGFFILLEDQCGVGDEIDIGPAIGTVESITLRATTLRDAHGHGLDGAQRHDPAHRQQEPRLVAGNRRPDLRRCDPAR